ncbi:MAG: hypothetical protein U5J99_04460 [Parvularculaceae bacterium]|nr:hypothetical protein [Parvularculaceae bacterium]
MIGRIGVFCAALLAAGSALASDPVKEVDALDGFVETGETVGCVSMRSTGVDAVDENRLLFKVGSRYYLNETRGTCERAESTFFRLEARLFSTRACRGDIFNVVDNQSGFFAGACSLGEFKALARKPKDPSTDSAQ